MDENIDWQQAHAWYLLVFNHLRSQKEEDEVFSEAVVRLRTVYVIQTYRIGRKLQRMGPLDDEASSAWTRFIAHCLTASAPYDAIRALVTLQTKAVLLDDIKRRMAQKRNCGKEPLAYDESYEGEPIFGMVAAMESASPDLPLRDVLQALDLLASEADITSVQKAVFLSYAYDGLSINEIIQKYRIAKAGVFRHVNHVGRLLRKYLKT